MDPNGNAYVTGAVGQNIIPTVTLTPPAAPPPPFPDGNAIQPPVFVTVAGTPPTTFDAGIAGSDAAFLTKISATGASVLYSTYLGGSVEEPETESQWTAVGMPLLPV